MPKPKGLYVTGEDFSFFLTFFLLFRRLISEVTEGISTKLGHIFTYDCMLFKKIWSELPRACIYRHGLGGKQCFLGTDFEICLNISLQQNMISTIRKKFVYLQGLSYMLPKSGELSLETAENGWRVFAHSQIFEYGYTASLTA